MTQIPQPDECATVEWRDRVAVVTIARPPVNALRFQDYRALRRLLTALEHDGRTRCIVLTGSGSRAFVGGHDVNEFVEFSHTDALESLLDPRLLFETLHRLAIPVIAALNGPAVGSGLAISAFCDIRIATPDAFLALPEVDRGVLGGAKALMRMVPAGTARLMMLTGQRLSADEALALGAYQKIVAPEALLDEALAIAATIAAKDERAIRMVRPAMNEIEAMTEGDAYAYECTLTARMRLGEDRGAGAAAFLSGGQLSAAG